MVLLENGSPKVLIVDDKAENLAILVEMLRPLNLELVLALSAKEVYERVKLYDFDLILLDIVMPEIDGYTVCKELKKSQKYRDIPLIFISSLSGCEDKIKGFASGGDDYITKPLIQKELLARVKLHLQKGILFKSLKQLLRKSYHELYNPLAVINTSLEMQTIKNGSTNYTDAITVASRTLQTVYDDLYYSLSPQTLQQKRVEIDLSKFVQKRIDYFYYFKESKNINIEFNTTDECLVGIGEADLQRIVDNTLSNAIKYASSNSIVNIEVLNMDDSILFRSKNRGSVIKNPQKIFNQGYRENFEQIGMGIGLEIVASICHKCKIEAEVVSQDNETCFKYKIPKE